MPGGARAPGRRPPHPARRSSWPSSSALARLLRVDDEVEDGEVHPGRARVPGAPDPRAQRARRSPGPAVVIVAIALVLAATNVLRRGPSPSRCSSCRAGVLRRLHGLGVPRPGRAVPGGDQQPAAGHDRDRDAVDPRRPRGRDVRACRRHQHRDRGPVPRRRVPGRGVRESDLQRVPAWSPPWSAGSWSVRCWRCSGSGTRSTRWWSASCSWPSPPGSPAFLVNQIPDSARARSTSTSRRSWRRSPCRGSREMPLVGEALFTQTVLVYMMYVAIVVVPFVLYQTRWGLRVRSVGEHPKAADTVGIRVNRVRWQAVLAVVGWPDSAGPTSPSGRRAPSTRTSPRAGLHRPRRGDHGPLAPGRRDAGRVVLRVHVEPAEPGAAWSARCPASSSAPRRTSPPSSPSPGSWAGSVRRPRTASPT